VRVAGDEEGEDSKAMAMVMAIRMLGKWSATATKRLMVMATSVEEQANHKLIAQPAWQN
jgi:hypothetical protein